MDFEFIKNSLLDIEKKIILSLQCPESKNMLYESIKNNINIIYRNIDSFARSCKEAKNKDKHIRSIVRSIIMSTNDNGIINSASEICRNLDIIMKGVYDSREIEQKAKKLNSEIYSVLDCDEKTIENFIFHNISIYDFVGIYSDNLKTNFQRGKAESITGEYIIVSGVKFPYHSIRFIEIYK